MKEPQRTIFVVDASQSNLWHLMQTLGEDGYRVVVCARAQTALRMLDEEAPDAILINVADPVLRGYDLYRAIRRDRRLRQVPVMMMTRDRHLEQGVPGIDRARVRYVNLPLDGHQVLDQIRQGLVAAGPPATWQVAPPEARAS